jgi:hypothetical protein
MSDPQLVIEVLSQVLASTKRILIRFKPVESVSFFLDTEEGLEKRKKNLSVVGV